MKRIAPILMLTPIALCSGRISGEQKTFVRLSLNPNNPFCVAIADTFKAIGLVVLVAACVDMLKNQRRNRGSPSAPHTAEETSFTSHT